MVAELVGFAGLKRPPPVVGVDAVAAPPKSGFCDGVVEPKSEGVVGALDAAFPL